MSSGCGCKEVHVYRFPHITYPYSSCICSFFAAASLLFVHKKNVFVYIYIYILYIYTVYRNVKLLYAVFLVIRFCEFSQNRILS